MSWDAAALERALGVPVVVHGVIDSTMTAADADPRAPVLHLAEEQTAGRGRHERAWISPPGNLYATLAWPEPGEPLPPATLAAIQVAWAEAVAAAGGPRTLCKWPNDGMIGEGKWAGLLARRAGGPGAPRLLIGMGANLEVAPPAAELSPGAPPAAALADHWRPWWGRVAVGTLLLQAAVEVLRAGGHGVTERLARWSLHDALERGAPLRVETPSGDRRGRYEGLDADGRLRLSTPDGERRLAVGDARRVRPLA